MPAYSRETIAGLLDGIRRLGIPANLADFISKEDAVFAERVVKDGYITAVIRRDSLGVPNYLANIQITERGYALLAEFDPGGKVNSPISTAVKTGWNMWTKIVAPIAATLAIITFFLTRCSPPATQNQQPIPPPPPITIPPTTTTTKPAPPNGPP